MLRKVATVSQKNSGTNPLPTLINVAGCQNMCSFWFFSLSLLSQHWFWGEGGFKVFAFDILKVALVVPLHFLTNCSIMFRKLRLTKKIGFLIKKRAFEILKSVIVVQKYWFQRTLLVDTRPKSNVHKAFIWCLERHIDVF